MHTRLLLTLLGTLGAPMAYAQDDLGLGTGEAVDQTADSAWSPFLEMQTRFERTRDIPGRSDTLERARLKLRGGLIWTGAEGWEFGTALEAQVASSDNRDTRINNDNERSDQVLLDQLYGRYHLSDDSSLTLGKTTLPLTLTPLTWDADLRPIGASASFSGAISDYSNWHFDLGYYAPDHLFDDESRLAAAQLALGLNEGAPTSAFLRVGYLDFSDLQGLVDGGLGRTNRRVLRGGRPVLLSDYRLFDLIASGRTEVYGKPLELTVDYVRNTGADNLNEGARSSLVWGDARQGGLELGFAYQRIQRDAVVAAFSEDDWWFHSFARGGMPWVGYGFSPNWRMRLAAFDERRDGVAQNTRRVLLDVFGNW